MTGERKEGGREGGREGRAYLCLHPGQGNGEASPDGRGEVPHSII